VKYEDLKKASFISFKIAGKTEPVFRNPAVVARISSIPSGGDTQKSLCLVSGMADEIDPTHPSIKGVRDANTTGGNIVSFNAAAFCSFGKAQGANAPVGKAASFAYTTALEYAARQGFEAETLVGDATTIFGQKKDHS
jgi:CRISPR-associated protein Csd1